MISSDEEQKRREKFSELVKQLNTKDISGNVKLRGKIYTDIRCVYMGNTKEINFRHYYSDVFHILIELSQQGQDISLIGHNLQLLYEFSVDKKEYGIAECIKKLFDHVNLETSRITYLNGIEAQKIKPEDIDRKLADVDKEINDQDLRVSKLAKQTDDAYSSFIAILGIFSAIVMVFFGGTTVFSKAFSSVGDTPVDKMILLCTLCGLIIFDVIFMFIYFLSKLLDRNISATSECVYWKDIVSRFRIRYPIIFYTNLMGCVVILFSGLSMLLKFILGMKVNGATVYKIICDYAFNFIQVNNVFCVILLCLIVFNVIFLIAYLIAKITDINIGCRLVLKTKNPYWWNLIEDNNFVVYKDDILICNFNDENQMNRFIKRKNMFANSGALICNFARRLFCRYPYFAFVNCILLTVLAIVGI